MKIRIDFGEIRPALARCKKLSRAVGTIDPRPPGLHNDLIQLVKKLLARSLAWYTRPQCEFNLSVVRSLDVLAPSIVKLQTNLQVVAMDGRLTRLERDNTALMSDLQKSAQVSSRLESLHNVHKNGGPKTALASGEERESDLHAPCAWLFDFDELRSVVTAIERLGNAAEEVTPQPSGWYKDLVQPLRKSLAHLLAWYARPQREFNLSVVRCLDIIASPIESLRTNLQAIDERLPQLEQGNAALASSLQQCMELLAKLESPAHSQESIDLDTALASMASMRGEVCKPHIVPCDWCYDFDELRSAVAAIERPKNAVGVPDPLPPEWYNNLLRPLKKLMSRLLAWYTWPLSDFNNFVNQSLEEIVCAVGNLSAVMVALDQRLTKAEKRSAALAEAMQEQFLLLREQVRALVSLQVSPNLYAPAGRTEVDRNDRAREISQFYNDTGLGNDKTAYVIGLFGTGRLYINALMLQNIGERARYFRDGMRLHPGPTSMIYSGHATMRYTSRGQSSPAIMRRILEAVRSGFADVIFIYRHPLDSLLSNWIYWRTYARDDMGTWAISDAYKQTDDLCADVEQNFSEFMAFAQGDPNLFAAEPGPRFLSFEEFVEETELHLQSATLTLRLEDFKTDPFKEFSKIVEVMSLHVNLNRADLVPPKTKPYRYLTIKEKVPRFRSFIDGLNVETRRRIDRMGYSLG